MKQDTYAKLLDVYKLQPIMLGGEEVFEEALREFFTPEEAELAVQLTAAPERITDLCQRIGRREEEVSALLESMARKGYVQAGEVEGQKTYHLLMWVNMMENFFRRTDKTDPFVEKMVKWWEDFKLKTDIPELKPSPFRTIPVEAEIEKAGDVLPYESVTEVIKEKDYIAVADCYCRKPRLLTGQWCGNPIEVCLAFGDYARYLVKYGYGRRITQEETLALLRDCEDRGLVHSCDNILDIGWLCNCCGCCCAVLVGHVHLNRTDRTTSSSYIVSFDPERCSEAGICGICVDRCQVRAIAIEKEGELPTIDYEKCIGCGSCSLKCPGEALSMKRREQPMVPAEDLDKLYAAIYQHIGEQLSGQQ